MTDSPKGNATEESFDAPVISADLNCHKCNKQSSITFNPPISYDPEFIDRKSKLICPMCNSTYSSIPRFSIIEWQTLVKIKYDKLRKVVEDNFLQFVLGYCCTIRYKRLRCENVSIVGVGCVTKRLYRCRLK